MKCLIQFSVKNKKNISICRLMKIIPKVLSIKGEVYKPAGSHNGPDN